MSRRRTLSTSINEGRVTPKSYGSSKPKMKASVFELKEVLNYLKYEWPQAIESNANPIEMAIQLLDDSSVGLSHKMPEFEEVSENTSNALRSVVGENFDQFNNSIGSYYFMSNSTVSSQKDAEEIKEMLESTKREVHDNSDVLRELNSTFSRYGEMIEILDAMEAVNSIPGKIDQLIIDKKIHQVYDIISQGYTTAEKYNLWSLGVMSSIKNYLDLQSNNLFEMIIDELQNEIYLKNPMLLHDMTIWDQLITSNNSPKLTSFMTFIARSSKLEQYIYNSANLDLNEISECFNELVTEFIDTQLPDLFSNESSSLNLTFDLSGNQKNYHYIYQLLMTASKLNRLSQATQILTQSNQQEFHGLLYRTIEETKSKNLHEMNKLNKMMDFEEFDDKLINFNDASVKVLKDLFSSVFIKSLMVLQKQKLVMEVAKKFDLEYDLKSSWNVIKNELSTLMLSYITESATEIQKNHVNLNEVFKFDSINFGNNELIQKFPNLMERNEEFGTFKEELFIKDESFQSNLQVLVPVNVFNMRVIIEFFLIFVSSTTHLINDKSKPVNQMAIQFFESFMKISFLPKLRDTFDWKFNQIMGEETGLPFKFDTISVDDSSVYENSFEFKKFFITLCNILNTSLTYRHELNDLVLQFLEKFFHIYDRVFNGIVGSSNVKLGNWLKTPALNDISTLILNSESVNDELINKEIELMLQNQEVLSITKDDLLDDEALNQICHLLLTSTYILKWLPNLGKESNYNYEGDLNVIEKLKHDWNFLENGKKIINEDTNTSKHNINTNYDNMNIYLSLNTKKYQQFNDIIRKFEKIKLNSLIILRYDLRLKAIYYATRSFKESDWVLKNEPGDADPFISGFNKVLFSLDNKVNSILNEQETPKIMVGMSSYMNELLIVGSCLIHKINSNGIKKVLINIFTLQQMLRNLNRSNWDIEFKRCSRYFDLFTINENQLPAKLTDYSASERENMVRLLYSEKLADGNGSSFNISKYNDLLAKVK